MKKKLCCLLAFLLIGCSSTPKQPEKIITYAAAQYCLDDDCKEKIKMEYDARDFQTIIDYIDALPVGVNPAYANQESARLVLHDEQGMQYTWVEKIETTPSEKIYWLKALNDNGAIRLQSRSFTEFLQTLKGQELPTKANLGYVWQDDFMAVSYSDYYFRDQVENEKMRDVLSLLFYIDDEFDDVNDIQNTPRLLTGLANNIEKKMKNHMLYSHAEEYSNHLITSAEAFELSELETKAYELLNNYSLPNLESEMLGVTIENSYYYDKEHRQVIRHYQNTASSLLYDWVLLPLKIEENRIRVVKVPVKNRMYMGASTIENIIPIIDNAVVRLTSNYRDLYAQIVEHLDQFDIMDVGLDEFQRLKSMHYVHHAKTSEKLYPLQSNAFILNEEGGNSIYTLQSLSPSAEYYNNVMRTINYSIIHSVLKENDRFIMIEVSYGYKNDMEKMNFLFDKLDGQLLSDGLLSERYYENQLGKRIDEKMVKQNLPVCALRYEENMNVSECYVQPLIEDKADPYVIQFVKSSFEMNEKSELYYPVLIREYGTYSRILEMIP